MEIVSTASNANNTFEYKPNGCHKLLPIDYSLDELGKKWGMDPRAIKKYLFNPSFLGELLMSLSKNYDAADTKIPLPVEVEPFLKSFAKLADLKEFRALFRGTKDQMPKENLDRVVTKFSTVLCENLSKVVCSPSANDDVDAAAFCRHILFQNSTFNSIVMRQQWKEQIELRITQIQKLSQQVMPEQQVKALLDCLTALDKVYLELHRAEKIDSLSSSASPPAPDSLLNELLLERQSSCRDDKFELTNIPLPDGGSKNAQKLEEAFERLNCTKIPNPELMKQARSCYHKDLANKKECSIFEKDYLDLLGYLDFSKTELDETQLTQQIATVMKQACVPSICRCCNYNTDNLKNKNQEVAISPSYFDAFLTSESRTRIQEAINHFDDTVFLISLITELRNRFWNLWVHHYVYPNEYPEDKWEQALCWFGYEINHITSFHFPRWFSSAWAYLYQENIDVENIQRDQMYRLVETHFDEFNRDGSEAASYLGSDVSTVVQEYTEKYSWPFDVKELSHLNSICKTSIHGICLTFRRLIEYLAPQVAENVKFLQQHWLNYPNP